MKYPTSFNVYKKTAAAQFTILLPKRDENGRIQDPRVESSSRPEFEQPALKAVARWRFRPGTREGQPVRTYVRQQIQFKLNQ